MKTKKHQFRFNLIEIILAMGVVALGMTAVLALLSPALNANRGSLGETVAAEAAANMITYIDRVNQFAAGKTVEFDTTDTDPSNDDAEWSSNLENVFSTSAPDAIPEGKTYNSEFAEPFQCFRSASGTSWLAYVPDDVAVANVYVWMKKIEKQPNESHDGINQLGTTPNVRSCYRFYIKVSWPADAPPDASFRQERTFVYEVLRPVKR